MQYKLVNTAGQITAVITSKININDLSKIAKSLMRKKIIIEQVGYLSGRRFIMMGGELSINGLIAGAYLTKRSGKINQLNFSFQENTIALRLPKSLVLNIEDNIVKLNGITYLIKKRFPTNSSISKNTKSILISLARDTFASGIIYYQNNTIKPLIYVPVTESFVWENACGSGSLAFALVTGIREVIQPSGEKIKFKIFKKYITVTTTVKEI